MSGMTVCSDCGRAYQVSGTFEHICPERTMAAARGFEGVDDVVRQLAPSTELVNRVRRFTSQSVSWDWSIEVTDAGIHRVVTVTDTSLPESFRKTQHALLSHEDWEDAFQVLGLLP